MSWVPCLRFDDFMLVRGSAISVSPSISCTHLSSSYGMGYWGTAVVRQMKLLTDLLGLNMIIDTLHITRHLGHKELGGDKWMGAGKVRWEGSRGFFLC